MNLRIRIATISIGFQNHYVLNVITEIREYCKDNAFSSA